MTECRVIHQMLETVTSLSETHIVGAQLAESTEMKILHNEA